MKKEKVVKMGCPSCGNEYPERMMFLNPKTQKPTVILIKKCQVCGSGLIRKVTEKEMKS